MERRRLTVRGTVQGVGFRPFVHGVATRLGLAGTVLNDPLGVVVEAEGPAEALDALARALREEAPALARVESVEVEALGPATGAVGFAVLPSPAARGAALVPPDVATCADCLRELFDPADRRYRYPFVNCTACGPRFTIVVATPYDRARTTMAGFPLCAACRGEYEDPANRRFHAEPVACPACGPRLDMPLGEAVSRLSRGEILAVKGLGSWHLACDATDEAAVARLRARKHREEKPFAVMAADPAQVAAPTEEEWTLLRSPAAPIVLARARPGAVAPSVSPGSPWLGVMLPYTPLHHLLCADLGRPLVMTSGNRSDEPICIADGEARERLRDIADAFLGHDRPIHRRCEDSVQRAAFPIRRSRGRAPASLALPLAAPVPLVAAGAELKATFCVARGDRAFLSPHLGDLDSEAAYRAFQTDLELVLGMLGVEPGAIACDLHPGYLATQWARREAARLGLEPVEVQHHHAHAAACLAESREPGPALALVLDGTGLGPDGTLWGGELLRCNLASFERLGGLRPVPLPGGEAAIREPWRAAAAHLEAAGWPAGEVAAVWPRWRLVRQALGTNAPLSSGMGRLFDAVGAVLGVRAAERATYEGQAAVELELLAGDTAAAPWDWTLGDGAALVRRAREEAGAGRPRAEIAAAFHETVALACAEACAAAGDPAREPVALSGGCFQNIRLLDATRARLEERGFRVLVHRLVPPNDGGISYGQAAVAAARLGAAR